MGKGGGPKKRRGTPSGEKGSTHRNVRGAGLWGAHHKPARGPPSNPANPGCPSKVVDTPTANQPSQPASPPVQKQGGQRQTKTKTARKPPWTQLCGGRGHPAHRETDLLPATQTRGGETAGGIPKNPKHKGGREPKHQRGWARATPWVCWDTAHGGNQPEGKPGNHEQTNGGNNGHHRGHEKTERNYMAIPMNPWMSRLRHTYNANDVPVYLGLSTGPAR